MSGGYVAQLKEAVLKEGGTWTGMRAMGFLHSVGFDCTVQRARQYMKRVSEEEPARVVVAEGRRWVWEVREPQGSEMGEKNDPGAPRLDRGHEGAAKAVAGENVEQLRDDLTWTRRMLLDAQGEATDLATRAERAEALVEELRASVEEARGWARHGYELGQRNCTWSDWGVAPAWLTDGYGD